VKAWLAADCAPHPLAQKTRAAEAALIPWIEFGPGNGLEREMQGKLNQARTADRTLDESCPELRLPV